MTYCPRVRFPFLPPSCPRCAGSACCSFPPFSVILYPFWPFVSSILLSSTRTCASKISGKFHDLKHVRKNSRRFTFSRSMRFYICLHYFLILLVITPLRESFLFLSARARLSLTSTAFDLMYICISITEEYSRRGCEERQAKRGGKRNMVYLSAKKPTLESPHQTCACCNLLGRLDTAVGRKRRPFFHFRRSLPINRREEG